MFKFHCGKYNEQNIQFVFPLDYFRFIIDGKFRVTEFAAGCLSLSLSVLQLNRYADSPRAYRNSFWPENNDNYVKMFVGLSMILYPQKDRENLIQNCSMAQASSILECGRWLFFFVLRARKHTHTHTRARNYMGTRACCCTRWNRWNGTVQEGYKLSCEQCIQHSIPPAPSTETDISNCRKRIAKFIINLWHEVYI